MSFKIRSLAAVFAGVAAAVLTTAASAAPVVYFGENQFPGNSTVGAPVTARTSFLAGLSGVGSESFESFSIGAGTPLNIAFPGSTGNITATLTGQGAVNSGLSVGRFNTTSGGSQYWEVSGVFDITFSSAISAFGFYGTDIGDFDGNITLALTDINNVVTNLVVPNTLNGADGSLLFYGFIDTANSYTKISFGNTAAGVDFFGFDDMVIGDREQVVVDVPEPATLALVGLSLVGLAATRRRRQ